MGWRGLVDWISARAEAMRCKAGEGRPASCLDLKAEPVESSQGVPINIMGLEEARALEIQAGPALDTKPNLPLEKMVGKIFKPVTMLGQGPEAPKGWDYLPGGPLEQEPLRYGVVSANNRGQSKPGKQFQTNNISG
jgi:hypothetical protein